ncbi:MAG: hypothetical protein ABEJ03_00180 [Candidatus Nanohaloarchaea archaeon]
MRDNPGSIEDILNGEAEPYRAVEKETEDSYFDIAIRALIQEGGSLSRGIGEYDKAVVADEVAIGMGRNDENTEVYIVATSEPYEESKKTYSHLVDIADAENEREAVEMAEEYFNISFR